VFRVLIYVYRRKTCSTIVCGHIITSIAQSLNLGPKLGRLSIQPLKAYKHDRKTLWGMGVIKKFGEVLKFVYKDIDGSIKLWEGPEELDLPTHLPEVGIQQVRIMDITC
jgi:hypothetical protein